MRRSFRKSILWSIVVPTVLLLFFQNCGELNSKQDTSETASSLDSFIVEDSSPGQVEVTEGSSVQLFAEVSPGSSALSYVWRKEGENVDLGSESEYSFVATLADSGTYFLIIEDSSKQVTLEFEVNVAAATELTIPSILSKGMTSFTRNQGGSWIVDLSISGSPTPVVQWYRGTTPPEGSILPGQTSASLNIANVQEAHEGSYYAVATNSEGSAAS